MNPILETLFSTLDSPLQHEAELQAAKASQKVFQVAEEKLTHEEFDALWTGITDIDSASNLDSFTQGFRLGVQLTLEGLRPVYPD